MNSGGAAGLLGAVAGTILLFLALSRVRLRRLEIRYGEEFGRFGAYLVAVLLVWVAMGLVATVPVLGPALGWPWMGQFLSRLDPSDPIRTLLGLVVAFICVPAMTVCAYAQAYSRLFLRWRRFAFPFSVTGRWTVALASLYLGALSLDLVRLIFFTDRFASFTWASLSVFAGYTLVIAGAPLVENQLRLSVRGFSIVQLAAVVLLNAVAGNLLRTGSLHLGPLPYAEFFRGLTGSIPGAIAVAAGALLLVLRIWKRWKPRAARGMAAAGGGAAQTHTAPAGPARPSQAGPRWRKYNKETGKRVDWP